MSYLVLVLLAIAAGLLFGGIPLAWPWERPHPVRTTTAMALFLLGGAILIVAHLFGWDDTHVANLILLAVVGALFVGGVCVPPNRPGWTVGMYVLGYGWWLYHLYGQYRMIH